MPRACSPDACHLANSTLLRMSPPAQSTTRLSQGSSPDGQGYAAMLFIWKTIPMLTTSKKPTTSNPDPNASANGRIHKVENGYKGDKEMKEIMLGARLPALQATRAPWANASNITSPDVSRHVRMTQNAHSECIAPAPAGQSPKTTEDASSRSKHVPPPMPPKTASEKALDVSLRVKTTQNTHAGWIEPAAASRVARMSTDVSSASKCVPPNGQPTSCPSSVPAASTTSD